MFEGLLKWLVLVVVVYLLYEFVNRQQELAYQAARRGGFSWGPNGIDVQF